MDDHLHDSFSTRSFHLWLIMWSPLCIHPPYTVLKILEKINIQTTQDNVDARVFGNNEEIIHILLE